MKRIKRWADVIVSEILVVVMLLLVDALSILAAMLRKLERWTKENAR